MAFKYESAKETAIKIREVLKFWFPGVKFSVRSESFSGDSSVDVSYKDGPALSLVESLVNGMASGAFDSSQDLSYSVGYEWNGELINGAKYVSVRRDLSEEIVKEVALAIAEKYHVKGDPHTQPLWQVQGPFGHNLGLLAENFLHFVNIGGPELQQGEYEHRRIITSLDWPKKEEPEKEEAEMQSDNVIQVEFGKKEEKPVNLEDENKSLKEQIAVYLELIEASERRHIEKNAEIEAYKLQVKRLTDQCKALRDENESLSALLERKTETLRVGRQQMLKVLN